MSSSTAAAPPSPAARPDTPAAASPAAGPSRSATPSLLKVELNEARACRWGWFLVLAGIGGFMAWASVAPLDAGVGSPGVVVVSGNRKTVQPLIGGKIVQLSAKDGAVVKAGHVLVRLDDTLARSQLEVTRGQWLSALAVQARLVAERTGRAVIDFPDTLRRSGTDARAAQAMSLQGELFATRRRALQSDVAVLRENINGLDAQLQGLEEASRNRRDQSQLLRDEIERQRGLVRDGFLPRNRLSEQERALAAVMGALAEDAGNIGRTRQQIAEQRARIIAREQEQRKEVESQLTDVQREAESLTSRLRALEFEVANTEIVSPADGIVVGLAVHTVGGVVQSGAPIMEIVPADDPLRIDAQLAPHLIDKVHSGLPVDVMFSAFQQATTPHVPGTVTQVSADVLVEPKQGIPYFKVVVEVTPEGMRRLRDHRIRVGMPAEVFVRTGERTLLNYLVKPMTDRLNRALSEP